MFRLHKAAIIRMYEYVSENVKNYTVLTTSVIIKYVAEISPVPKVYVKVSSVKYFTIYKSIVKYH